MFYCSVVMFLIFGGLMIVVDGLVTDKKTGYFAMSLTGLHTKVRGTNKSRIGYSCLFCNSLKMQSLKLPVSSQHGMLEMY